MTSDTPGPVDPLSPQQAPGISLVVQMRLYDVAMAILREMNEEVHTELLQAHSEGLILGPVPEFAGRFLTNEANP